MKDTGLPEYPSIPSITWPVKGGDMSPIENIWGVMVKRLNGLKYKDLSSFWEAIQNVWRGISDDKILFLNLYNSLPKRMQAVENETGLWKKYWLEFSLPAYFQRVET